jgi:hypothetical protein
MKLVHSALNITEINIIKNMLENNGIPCLLKNEELNAMARGMPEFFIELWVKQDGDSEKALKLITQFNQKDGTEKTGFWICGNCKEKIEGQFDSCWNCGTNRPP